MILSNLYLDPNMRKLALFIIAIIGGNLYGKARMDKRAASIDEKKLYSRFTMASTLVSLTFLPPFVLAREPYGKYAMIPWGILMFLAMKKLAKDKKELLDIQEKEAEKKES